MATILTVHGTFASGPETGDHWWQRESPCEARIRAEVVANAGDLRYEPFIWNGLNSESARRAAGAALFQRLQALDAHGEPCVVVGHSHGGSVIGAALLEAARRKNPLPRLHRWISVGTPFIETRKQGMLFQRLSLLGKAVYVAMLLAALIFGALFAEVIGFGDWARMARDFDEQPAVVVMWAASLTTALLPLIAYSYVAHLRERRRLPQYDAATRAFAQQRFLGRWISLWHKNDEAVQGLKSLRGLELAIFDRGFLTGPLSLLAVLALPALVVWTAASPAAMTALVQEAVVLELDNGSSGHGMIRLIGDERDRFGLSAPSDAEVADQLESLRAHPDPITSALALRVAEGGGLERLEPAAKALGADHRQVAKLYVALTYSGAHIMENLLVINLLFITTPAVLLAGMLDDGLAFGVGLLLLPVALVAVSVVAVGLFTALARLVSWMISRGLNPAANSQIKLTAFGSDTREDLAVHAQEWPVWLGGGHPPLPDALGDSIEARSDAAISATIPKFRGAIQAFTEAESDAARADMISRYLTWNELIHTTYFDDPAFVALLAYEIGRADGFALANGAGEAMAAAQAWSAARHETRSSDA